MRSGGLIPWRRGREHNLPIGDQPMPGFDRDFGGLLDRFFDMSPYMSPRFMGAVEPGFGAVDLSESNGAFVAKVDLPGVEETDIDLELSGNRLSIHAKREREEEKDEDGFHQHERAFGAVTRQLALPDDVDAAKTSAMFKDGVLTITLPKTESAKEKTRKIPLKH